MAEIMRTFTEVAKELHREIEGMSLEQIKKAVEDKTTKLHLISRIIKRYTEAEHAAPKFGLIGVGKISFAEARIVRFQERVARRCAA